LVTWVGQVVQGDLVSNRLGRVANTVS